ncbi:MAG TPA: NAD(P)/FAD-dependent oxidoreductase [Vicinamibacterales bacterium]|nr:NAD(P)/FAD-dependent oxidoreductase [Vicinamibacterales bacterium]
MRASCDVVVVGAGPAGATAARTLAAGGASVCLLERARFPRNKPCGGGITVRALARFPWLGPALPRIATHYVSRLVLEAGNGATAVLTSEAPAVLLVRRYEFDHLLACLAGEAGASLVEEAWVSQADAGDREVTVRTRDGREFVGRYLVAADGVNGVTTRRLGLHPGWDGNAVALDMMEETPNGELRARDPGTLWVSYGHGGTDGYGYVFPKRDHVNVGIGCLLSYFRERIALAPYEMQQDFVGHLVGRGVLEGESRRRHFTPSHIPVGGPIARTAQGRVLVAGDAGGFVNAYSAEGIYYAMVTGDLAGRAITDALRNEGPPRPDAAAHRYVRMWKREVGGELRDSRLIQKYLFRNPQRIEAVVKGADAHPALANLIIAYAMGSIPYGTARRRILSKFPGTALRLARIALFG